MLQRSRWDIVLLPHEAAEQLGATVDVAPTDAGNYMSSGEYAGMVRALLAVGHTGGRACDNHFVSGVWRSGSGLPAEEW